MKKKPTESSDFKEQLNLFVENFKETYGEEEALNFNKKDLKEVWEWRFEFSNKYRIKLSDLWFMAPFVINVFAPKFALLAHKLDRWFFPEGIRLMQKHRGSYDFTSMSGSWEELMKEQWNPFPTIDRSEFENEYITLGYDWGYNINSESYTIYAEMSVALYLLYKMTSESRGEFLELCIDSYGENDETTKRKIERKIKEAEIKSLQTQWSEINSQAKEIEEKINAAEKELVENYWNPFFDKPKENTIVKFEINSVRDYGISGIINGNISGFVHVTELSWTECLNPNDVFNVGDIIDAFVLEINEERKIVQLGVKQLAENPWEVFFNNNNKGDVVKGEVFAVSDFGVIIKLSEGVTGTLHNDDISYDQDYRKCFVKGQKVDVILLGLDAERERISLGIKQINQSSWDKFMEYNKTGTIVTALIKRFCGEKIIAEIGDGIEAFVKIQLDESGQQTNKPLGIGDKMKAEILSIDKRSRIIKIACFLKD